MTSAAPTEIEGLTGRVLAIIGAYRMGVGLDARELYARDAPSTTSPESNSVPDDTRLRYEATLTLDTR